MPYRICSEPSNGEARAWFEQQGPMYLVDSTKSFGCNKQTFVGELVEGQETFSEESKAGQRKPPSKVVLTDMFFPDRATWARAVGKLAFFDGLQPSGDPFFPWETNEISFGSMAGFGLIFSACQVPCASLLEISRSAVAKCDDYLSEFRSKRHQVTIRLGLVSALG